MRIGSEFIICIVVAVVVMVFAPNYVNAEQVVKKAPTGRMYYKGDGVPQDYKKAFEAYSEAAKKGDLIAQSMLGAMYYTGKGVPKDHRKAFEAFKTAAEKGFDVAQYRLGYLHEYGIGTPQDHKSALKWLRRAAEQGNSDAKDWLLEMDNPWTSFPKSFYESILIDINHNRGGPLTP